MKTNIKAEIINGEVFLNEYFNENQPMIEFKKRVTEMINMHCDKKWEFALRNNAAPPVKGEITKGKLKWRGINYCENRTPRSIRMWIEQRGVKISEVVEITRDM